MKSNKYAFISNDKKAILIPKDKKVFSEIVTDIVDTNMKLSPLIDLLMENNFVQERKLTIQTIGKLLQLLNKTNVIAIDPENELVYNTEWYPDIVKKIRFKQKYGIFKSRRTWTTKSSVVTFFAVTNKRSKKTLNFETFEEVKEHCGCTFEDVREQRKGLFSKFDKYTIEKKHKESKTKIRKTIKFLVKPSGEKIGEDTFEYGKARRIYERMKK